MPDAYAESAIDVALNLKTQPYSRNIFGHFIEHFHTQVYGGIFDAGSDLSDAKGYRVDVIEAMREMRPQSSDGREAASSRVTTGWMALARIVGVIMTKRGVSVIPTLSARVSSSSGVRRSAPLPIFAPMLAPVRRKR